MSVTIERWIRLEKKKKNGLCCLKYGIIFLSQSIAELCFGKPYANVIFIQLCWSVSDDFLRKFQCPKRKPVTLKYCSVDEKPPRASVKWKGKHLFFIESNSIFLHYFYYARFFFFHVISYTVVIPINSWTFLRYVIICLFNLNSR